MIDVVFLLLIYFVMTMQPLDVIAHLEAFTPSADTVSSRPADPPALIRIGIRCKEITFDDAVVSLDRIDWRLGVLAGVSASQSVLIQCSPDSPHGRLIQVLNLCAKHRLANVSVVSANGTR